MKKELAILKKKQRDQNMRDKKTFAKMFSAFGSEDPTEANAANEPVPMQE